MKKREKKKWKLMFYNGKPTNYIISNYGDIKSLNYNFVYSILNDDLSICNTPSSSAIIKSSGCNSSGVIFSTRRV